MFELQHDRPRYEVRNRQPVVKFPFARQTHGSNRLKRQNAITWLCVLVVLVFVVGFVWSGALRDEIVLLLQPRYRVSKIDSAGGTMTMEGINQALVVRCQNLCNSFVVGGEYPMLYRGSTLEFRRNGKTTELEIIEIHVKPAAVPGGMG